MLHINDITLRLGSRVLFDQASAALPEGARIGLVGRNGTGKTTLFKMIADELAPDLGSLTLPKHRRLGRVEQEAPGGPGSLIDFVLAADTERAQLMTEAETATDPHRIAEIQTRLVDIEAHAAPSRAARILAGLGFDFAAQARPLSSFSGGWRMRVALAAVLFAQPDLLLLDEPTNYLDLEGTLWLIDYLQRYPATIIVISHDRDMLDAVCDHILHLNHCKLTLWSGNYSSFETQRREQQAIEAKHKKKQDEQRKHMQAFVDRFRASATKASQAQSRLKALAKMEPVTALVDGEVLPFHLPSPEKPLRPPIVAMDKVSVGYDGKAILRNLSLSIADDDRIGLLGSNGNGKSTFAKLVAARLEAMDGELRRSSKLDVGFFAQHQVDDLDEGSTPYQCIAPLMKGASEAQVRSKCAQIGFPNVKADTKIALLSGGEKARLLMGLSTFHAPHLIILDEPTNHLDIDSRAALIEAINAYKGAVILVSHDRYLLDACADRLWLVADGSVKAFDGDMDDYKALILGTEKPRPKAEKAPAPPPQQARQNLSPRKRLALLEEKIARFEGLLARVDAALADGDAFQREPAKAAQLARQRGELADALAQAEDEWLMLSAEQDAAE
ncbi:putative ABC transporter ATP-binding protein YheS [Beijerinckiaceae bacterium RH AL1]|nr:ABC-F family ATP-binding cassette domain-containing protein [Beijerinckiaceae bacterium]VVB46619.1 putative ABC transporter ATP-binding protein YheS [Beijerinckiaceae bacterium RH CH11]VVB46704.1 putative ABC transporter ATP-binding protein YheS [Beijerinckiaceae bacterium RH AL8]VVC55466.1 putative ABC transporter ATP-binding protein YheS [Beijerinckiaceae bacterium RH AL1]